MSIRKLIFWLHLIAGLLAGVVILIMAVTGAALAFEKEIIGWAERDVRRVTPPANDAKPLPLELLLARAHEAKPGERPSGITLEADPNAALLVSFGRTNAYYVNPYTGAVRGQSGQRTREFMQTMIEWHRYLGAGEARRSVGKAITGACNAAFLFLAVSGLCLWWPRQWTKTALRSVVSMNFQLRGKPRDWNWHNAVGLWTAPVLIVLTATALPISYQWAGNLIYRLTGSPAPAPGATGPAVEIPAPSEGTKPLGPAAMFEAAQREFPNWKQISQRSAGPGGRGRRPVAAGVPPAVKPGFQPGGRTSGETKDGENSRRQERADANPDGKMPSSTSGKMPDATGELRSPQPVTLTVIEKGQWPLFASTQLTLDPFTGAVLRKESFGGFNLGRRVRSWMRFLHTAEALGVTGRVAAAFASAAATLLVWTGFALAWRRFLPGRSAGLGPGVSADNPDRAALAPIAPIAAQATAKE